MADTLEIVRAKTLSRLEGLRRSLSILPSGRGSQLGPLLAHTITRVEVAVARLEAEIELSGSIADVTLKEQLLTSVSQRFRRLDAQLDVIHHTLATFKGSIGRPDVPVGLQHLIDLLMEQVVPEPGDPIVHLSPENMYSTADMELLIDGLLDASAVAGSGTFTGVRPVAFNLPALDPANALLSPVLAHEVAHTAVQQKLMADLRGRVDMASLDSMLQAAVAELGTLGDPAKLGTLFWNWCNELISDAVALVLTGPSFLWAFTTFAPPSDFAIVGTHPAERDRVRFHLATLDRLGWTDFLDRRSPHLTAWFRSVASAPVLTGSPEERFLRGATAAIEGQIAQLAIEHVGANSLSTEVESLAEEGVAWLKQGVPVVEYSDHVLSSWEVILLGWLAALGAHGDQSPSLPAAAGDHAFNAVLVKALELSSVVSAWRANERTGA